MKVEGLPIGGGRAAEIFVVDPARQWVRERDLRRTLEGHAQ